MKKLLAVLPMVAMGFGCGLLVGQYAQRAEESGVPGGMPGAIIILFAGLIIGLYLQIAVHEGGHLVFGLLTGYRFCSYRLGSLMVLKEEDRLGLGLMGVQVSPITTSLSTEEVKRTAQLSDFAALAVRLLHEAGVQKGDRKSVV